VTAKSLMFQGTGSDVGKSIIVAGLCRLASNRGINVAPFKPQNMSNNAAVCSDGGEIGRAQALQAQACRLPPSVHFNPVLLKPQSDRSAQVVVHGQVVDVQSAASYMQRKRSSLLPDVLTSHRHLSQRYDLVLIEGAGSPAEVNLRTGDIANMGFARAANTPVCIIADIDSGGVIAALVGTQAVLDPEDRALVTGFIINKFRGDPALFDDGLAYTQAFTGWQSFGVIPWLDVAGKLPQEDAVPLERSRAVSADSGQDLIKIAAPMLSRIANFDDLDPLQLEPDVEVQFVPPGQPIPLDVDAVVLLGTKSALADLRFLREQGWHHDINAIARAGRHVVGICGGYQMLGAQLIDLEGHDGDAGTESGLGLLDVVTTMIANKTVVQSRGTHHSTGIALSGYEIHVGRTDGPDTLKPFSILQSGPDGAIDTKGKVYGTYLHGLFGNDDFRRHWLNELRPQGRSASVGLQSYADTVDVLLDELATSLEEHIDVDALFAEAR
jgi:adenosylcobyric acid synthase